MKDATGYLKNETDTAPTPFFMQAREEREPRPNYTPNLYVAEKLCQWAEIQRDTQKVRTEVQIMPSNCTRLYGDRE